MMNAAERVAALVHRVGKTVTYRRVSGQSYDVATGINTPTYVEYSVQASIRDYHPRDITGGIRIGDRKVQIAGVDLPFAPSKDDKIVIGSAVFSIIGVDTREILEDSCLHMIQVRGAGA